MSKILCLVIFSSAFFLQNCGDSQTSHSSADTTQLKKANDWLSLFDGKTTKGWHTYGQQTAGSSWKSLDSTLVLDTAEKQGFQIKGGGDLVTDDEFENYDLKLEWKISRAGNSGIMFNVHEDSSRYKYTWYTGPEMQVADNDENEDGKIYKHRAGDLYDLIPSSKMVVKPAGQWNQAEIICNKGKLDLFLNNAPIISTMLWDDHWHNLVAGSKFKDMPGFGTFHKGHIALQDHGAMVWFRNIRIRQL